MASLLWYVIPLSFIKTFIEVSTLSLRPDPDQDRRHYIHSSCWSWLKSSMWVEVFCWKKPYSYSTWFRSMEFFWSHLEKKVDSPKRFTSRESFVTCRRSSHRSLNKAFNVYSKWDNS